MFRRALITVCGLALAGPSHAVPLSIADITQLDPLGFTCIAETYLEETDGAAALAFTLAGKTRLPRTCLPDPCDSALTREGLARLTGTDPRSSRFNEEWEEYYTRYADYCRKETTPSEETVQSDEEFWEPIVTTQRENTVARNSPSSTSRTSTSTSNFVPVFSSSTSGGGSSGGGGTQDPEDEGEVLGESVSPTPIPLPGGMPLMVTMIGALAFLRFRR